MIMNNYIQNMPPQIVFAIYQRDINQGQLDHVQMLPLPPCPFYILLLLKKFSRMA
jgi:hypothetical protein